MSDSTFRKVRRYVIGYGLFAYAMGISIGLFIGLTIR